MSLRGSVAIVGIGETAVGSLPECGSTEICAEAARLALADAGLTKDQVDGLVTCNPWVETHLYHAEMFSEYMQIFPKFCMTLNAGGATSLAAVQRAASAIVTGVCDTVLITHGDNARTGLAPQEVGAKMTTTMNPQFELPYGIPLTNGYAMAARAHMHEFGTTSEQLAQVAVSARKHAMLNPAAEMQTPLTIDDVLNSPVIADPLHVADCSLWSDGGAAFVVVAAERAKDFPNRPVFLLGVGLSGCRTASEPSEVGPVAIPAAPSHGNAVLLEDFVEQIQQAFALTLGPGGHFSDDAGADPVRSKPVHRVWWRSRRGRCVI